MVDVLKHVNLLHPARDISELVSPLWKESSKVTLKADLNE